MDDTYAALLNIAKIKQPNNQVNTYIIYIMYRWYGINGELAGQKDVATQMKNVM